MTSHNPLLEQFIIEGRELLDDTSQSLLALERSPEDKSIINNVFRSIHTLKGNSGLFDFSALGSLLHAGEELMVLVREGAAVLTSSLVDLLLELVDQVRILLDEIDEENEISADSSQKVQVIIAALEEALRDCAPADAQNSPPEDTRLNSGPLPDWAEKDVPPELLEPGPDGPAILFEYKPNKSCFFRGEDPIKIVSQLKDVRWRKLFLSDEASSSDDPYECWLVVRGVCAAPYEDIRYIFRYVEEETTFWLGSTEAEKDEITGGVSAGKLHSALAIIEKQEVVLATGGDKMVPSVVEVLYRCIRATGHDAEEFSFSPDGDEHDVDSLIEFVRTLTHRLNEKVAEAGSELSSASTSNSSIEKGDAKSPNKAASPGAKGEAKGDNAKAARVLRVDQSKIDGLMNLIGQLVVARNALPYIIKRLDTNSDIKALARELKEHAGVVDRISRELQSAIMEVRMLPVSRVFQRFPRMVRDVARTLSKKIELQLVGEETQADKNVIEALSEPMIHLVRNALDHGIEGPEERAESGKDEVGYIRLSARNENEMVVITIEDDGRGIDPALLRKKSVEKGLYTDAEVQRLSDEESQMLIFSPGFSTKDVTSDLSGRGVGMDVVRATIEGAGGRIRVDSEVGVGSTFTLSLPLSMAVSHVMTVVADQQLYGVGMDSVVETVRCRSDSIQWIKGREAFVLREQLIPILRLRKLLNLSSASIQNSYGEEAVLVLRFGGEHIGLVVDEFGENIEVLVRPLEGWMGRMKEYSGSAVLGDGQLLLVLDMNEVVKNGV